MDSRYLVQYFRINFWTLGFLDSRHKILFTSFIHLSSIYILNQKPMQIASGIEHTLVCTSSGAIHAFGSSKDGQVGNGQELNVDLPIELAKTFPNNDLFLKQSHSIDHMIGLVKEDTTRNQN